MHKDLFKALQLFAAFLSTVLVQDGNVVLKNNSEKKNINRTLSCFLQHVYGGSLPHNNFSFELIHTYTPTGCFPKELITVQYHFLHHFVSWWEKIPLSRSWSYSTERSFRIVTQPSQNARKTKLKSIMLGAKRYHPISL
jgi:hypothetical protein